MGDNFDYAVLCDTCYITVVWRCSYIIEFGLCGNPVWCGIIDTPDISPAGEVFDVPKHYSLCALKRSRYTNCCSQFFL